jgi:hypothetical protein
VITLIALLVVMELLVVAAWVMERRERAHVDGLRGCSRGCACRGSIEGRRPR